MSKYMNPKYAELTAYTPGEQPLGVKYIKLNTNESPYPPSPDVLVSIGYGELSDLRLYSDPDCRGLRKALGEFYDREADEVFVSNGSDDILNFAFMAFSEKGVVFPDITYGFYEVYAKLHGANYEKKPLCDDFTIKTEDYLEQNGKLIVIANPNAPTGIFKPLCEIERILSANPDSVVLVDEAYIDFGGESALKLLDKYNNLLVVRTYSKSRSLAGARLGFAFAAKEIIADLNKLKFSTNPYSINRLTLIAGEAALRNGKYYDDNAQKIIEIRTYVTAKLREMEFEVIESAANFVLAGRDDISGSVFAEEMKKRGILIRHFSGGRLEKYNRITIGTRAEMDAFLFAAEKIIKGAAL